VFERIRNQCAYVASHARFVRVDEARLGALVRELLATPGEGGDADPAHHHRASPEATLAYVLTLDAINFGSGWFPHLKKREGRSGYFSVALALAEWFDRKGPWSDRDLSAMQLPELARVLDQDPRVPPVAELLALYVRALRDLGSLLCERYEGRFEALVEAAGGRASGLVEVLCAMPFYRDVARLEGRSVPFYKRAQITAADLHLAFQGRGWGRFVDLHELTLFADNLVPHVLRLEGVLEYAPDLVRRIQEGREIRAGTREEIEIRACALHAVERMVEVARSEGHGVAAWQLDEMLWSRGQRPEIKAVPRHRTRTVFY
jgi:hypothetical protein